MYKNMLNQLLSGNGLSITWTQNGHVINVRTDRMASTVCTFCRNAVVYDQADGDKAKFRLSFNALRHKFACSLQELCPGASNLVYKHHIFPKG